MQTVYSTGNGELRQSAGAAAPVQKSGIVGGERVGWRSRSAAAKIGNQIFQRVRELSPSRSSEQQHSRCDNYNRFGPAAPSHNHDSSARWIGRWS